MMFYPVFKLIKLRHLLPSIINNDLLIRQRWRAMYEEYRIPQKKEEMRKYVDGKVSINVAFCMKLREVLFAVSIVTLIKQPVFCIISFNFLILMNLILIPYFNAYKSKEKCYVELANEAAIMILNYHFFCLTDFVQDAEKRNLIGYSICVVVTAIIGVNFLYLLLKFTIKTVRDLKIKRLKDKYKAALKAKKEAKEKLTAKYVNKLIENFKTRNFE